MMNKKLNLAKIVGLILLGLAVTFLGATHSQALTFPYPIDLVDPGISASGPPANHWYTEYTLHTEQFGPLDAFCVEMEYVNSDGLYQLVPVPPDLTNAAKIASLYYNGIIHSQADIQVAIWLDLGFFAYYPNLASSFPQLEEIRGYDLTLISIPANVYLAESPRQGSDVQSQDYLVSIPDISMIFLLGSAMIGVAIFGRKKVFNKKA